MVKTNWPTFDESMRYSSNYRNELVFKEQWEALKNRYEIYKTKPTKQNIIPKIIHQIWLGNSIPDLEKKMCEKIAQSLDSSWQYILWTEKNIKDLNFFKNFDLYNQTPNFGQKSDLLRYAVLNEMGGIYLDVDFLPVKPFDDLLDLEFFCGIAYDKSPNVFNGLIGTTQNNPLIQDLLELDRPLQYHDALLLMDSTGPFFLTRKLFENIIKNENIVAFPNTFFYPFPNFAEARSLGDNYKDYFQPETFCVHLWHSRWN
jgi:mannosyltransferase OCH1-like enzyme